MPDEITYRYCPECGSELNRLSDAGNPFPLVCSRCGGKIQPGPKLACAALLTRTDSVLLVKRAREPKKGFWCLPGGFVDQGETLESAAEREVEEETGLSVWVHRLFGLYSYPSYPIVVAVYEVETRGGQLRSSPECLEARWFGFAEIPWENLAFPSTADSLKILISRQT
ncbi:MAG: NUDIX domain-containing protein [Thermodesulfobacteriota bacterium]